VDLRNNFGNGLRLEVGDGAVIPQREDGAYSLSAGSERSLYMLLQVMYSPASGAGFPLYTHSCPI
jgi:hypothetical protein